MMFYLSRGKINPFILIKIFWHIFFFLNQNYNAYYHSFFSISGIGHKAIIFQELDSLILTLSHPEE